MYDILLTSLSNAKSCPFFLLFHTRVKKFYNSFRVKDKNSFHWRKIWHLFASTEPRCRRDISIFFRPLTMIFFLLPAGNFKALELMDDDFLNSLSTFWFDLWFFFFLVYFCYFAFFHLFMSGAFHVYFSPLGNYFSFAIF